MMLPGRCGPSSSPSKVLSRRCVGRLLGRGRPVGAHRSHGRRWNVETRNRWLSGLVETVQEKKDKGTYYDSQSGRHVPIHDESKCLGYLSGRLRSEEALDDARALGLAGALMWPPREPAREGDGFEKLFESWSLDDDLGWPRKKRAKGPVADEEDFTIFLRLPPKHDLFAAKERNEGLHVPAHVNLCFEYGEGGTALADLRSAATAFGEATRTSVGVHDPSHYEDPIATASGVATLVDSAGGGISRILLVPGGGGTVPVVDEDELLKLCEELCYLDVPGPTIKSRLVVHAHSEDFLVESLSIGITKYVVDGASLDMLADAVREQGRDWYRGGRPWR